MVFLEARLLEHQKAHLLEPPLSLANRQGVVVFLEARPLNHQKARLLERPLLPLNTVARLPLLRVLTFGDAALRYLFLASHRRVSLGLAFRL